MNPGAPRELHRFSHPVLAWHMAAAICLALLGLWVGSGMAQAATTRPYPDVNTPCNTTLQACIDGAAAGDTITIAAGTIITAEITVNKGLTLTGAGPALTILHAASGQRVMSVDNLLSDGVVLTDLRVAGGNLAASGGGISSGFGTPLRLVNVEIRDNTVTGPPGSSGGGAVVLGPLTLINTVFLNNHTANGNGGGLRAANTVTATDSRFENNTTFGLGGGLHVDGVLVLQNTVIISNATTSTETGEGAGGGIYAEQDAHLINATVMDNRANFGGGLYASASVAITDTDFLSNTGVFYGGGLLTHADGRILRGQFVGNRTLTNIIGAVAGGGAIYHDYGTLTIDDAHFVGNQTVQQGGALMMTDDGSARFVVANSTFVGNQAQSGGALEGAGAITLTDSSLVGNQADADGGGIKGLGLLVITRGTFRGNRATHGAGVAASGNLTVTGSLFVTNTATGEGGALASSGHSLIRDSHFDRNAANLGGALWLGVLNGNAIDRTTLTRNQATTQGGAIFVHDSTALTLTNSLLVGNLAGEEGGGIAGIAPGLHGINVTLAYNQAGAAGGGGIKVMSNGGLDLGNSILWANVPDQIRADHPLTLTGPNLIQGGAFDSLNQDPRFIRSPNLAANDLGDLRLRQESPALDAGDGARLPAGLTLDLDGNPRRFDVTGVPDIGSGTPPIDLGAYEANNQLPTAAINGPYAGHEGTPIGLSATGSSSGDGGQALASFAWDCNDDGTFDVTTPQATGSSCLYPDQGNFTLRLQVTDAGGFTDELTATVSVQNVAPLLGGQANQTAAQGAAKTFALGTFADPGADAPWQVTVMWGDGQTSSFNRNNNGALPGALHIYTQTGSFTATVTVTDKDGATGSAGFGVDVTAQPGEVTGRAVIDQDGNGQADPGEPALAGATVTLDDLAEGVARAAVQTTTTNAQGEFRFSNVAQGSYILRIVRTGYVTVGPVTVMVQGGQVTQTGTFGVRVKGPDILYLPNIYRNPLVD